MKNIYGIILAGISLCWMSIGAQAHTVEDCDEVERQIPYYSGWASCSAYSSNAGWVSLSDYFSYEPSSFVRLWDYVTYYQNGYPYSEYVSCSASIPYAGSTTVTEQVCETVDHEHERTTVAIADVHDDEMDVFDSSCSWSGWQSHTMGRTRTLSCDGQSVASVTHLLGYPYNGEECNANITDSGYSLANPGSTTCYIRIYRND